jgi:hypothetical protein
MEDFLELAKENTDKDLETCGILGAFLVRLMLSLYILEPEYIVILQLQHDWPNYV